MSPKCPLHVLWFDITWFSMLHRHSFSPSSLSLSLSLSPMHQQASKCLEEHTVKIRSENKQLRAELKQLIETTNDLQLQKKRLSRQYNTLLREHQLNQDLQRLSVYGTTRSTGGGGNEGGRNGRTLPEISSPHTSSVLQ